MYIERKILLHALLFLFLYAAPAISQQASVYGKIISRETGKPLSGAHVIITIPGTNKTVSGTYSTENGSYEINTIPPGTYTVKVSYVGFETEIFENFLLQLYERHHHDVYLKSAAIEAEPVIVTAFRQSVSKLESSASISVLDTLHIQSIQPMTPADHVTGLPGLDVAKTGISQSNVAIRGFNDVFSGSLLFMTDSRISRIPSLRYNAYNFVPVSNDDIEKIEIIRGPASSLYGPNSANGVFHIITKSPFGSEGTTLNFGFGERNIVTVDIRNAGLLTDKLGYKITGSFLQGDDFESSDAFEDSVLSWLAETDQYYSDRGLENPNRDDPHTLRVGQRDYLVEKLAGTAALEYRPDNDLKIVVNGGINRASNMDMTRIGAAQIKNWIHAYVQTRITYRDIFIQSFINTSDAGETFMTRDGRDFTDRSKFYMFQIRNSSSLGSRQTFTYGLDAYRTLPVTDGTVHGIYEDDDDINETGIYIQSETDFSDKIKLIASVRYDKHSRLNEPFISPRLSMELTPSPNNKIRFTATRAFTTPTAENLFLDRLTSPLIPDRLISFSSFARFQPFNVRVRGVPESGFSFRRDTGGGIDGLYMQPVPLYVPPPGNSGHIPADATRLWQEVIDIITQVKGSGLEAFYPALRNIPAPTQDDVASVLKVFNMSTGKFETIDPAAIRNIQGIESTKTSSFEIGYTGLFGSRLLFRSNVFYNRIEDFIGPLLIETPNVFFDETSLAQYLKNQQVGGGPDNADDPVHYMPFAELLAGMIASVPVGTVTPNESVYPGDVMLTYRNFGDVNLYGLELDFTLMMNKNLHITGAYSYVSKDIIRNVGDIRDIALNAPKNKFNIGMHFRSVNNHFGCDLRYRFIDGFPVNSGVYTGNVEPYGIFDFNTGWELPGNSGLRLTLTVQNVLDYKHQEFIGAPTLGRLAHLQMKFFLDKYKN